MPTETQRVTGDGPVDAESYAKAIFNILDDFGDERERLNDTQRAVLNILDDFGAEREKLDDTQRAVLNILDDFDIEKKKVDQVNIALRNEVAEHAQSAESLRRAKDAAEVANKELEAFSYSVSHDLRTPLRSIDGFSQALLEDYADKLDDEGKRHLVRVRAGAQRMGQLIDDLLKLSQVARSALRRTTVDLSRIVREVSDELRQSDADRQVAVVIKNELTAEGDPQLLKIALENLMGNAWKFTSKQPQAQIEFGNSDPVDGRSTFFVRDNGAGFDMRYADKLFGAFQRLHGITEFPGTGIGLATVQRVIHRHGGKVWAEGAVGLGATFFFTL